MKAVARALAMAGMLALLVFAGWRIVGLMQAERLAASDPELALAHRPGDPRALLVLAERRLREGDAAGAAAAAHRLLAKEPLEGRAFRVLGAAEDQLGRKQEALRLYRIAARRAPRDIPARAWLAQHELEHGAYAEALAHVDYVLRTSPGRTEAMYRIVKQLAPLARDPAFADALADVLRADPPWRDYMLLRLKIYPDASSRVLQRLQRQGALRPDEYAAWLDSLLAKGRWGEAYARWASHAIQPGQAIPLLYNGDFARSPGGLGFDWRVQEQAGAQVGFEAAAAGKGGHMKVRFLDQQVDRAGLRHPLLLFPGKYRLTLRLRARDLQGMEGVVWRIECTGKAGVIATGEPIHGSFDWQPYTLDFTVPEEGCQGQWLALVNGSRKQGMRRLAGELAVDDGKIEQRKD